MARAVTPDLALSWRDTILHEIRQPSALAPSEHPLIERAIEVLQLVAQGRSKQAALYAVHTGLADPAATEH